MLRKTLIGLGALITLLPYLGFPTAVDTVISTASGLMIISLLMFGRKVKAQHDVSGTVTEVPRPLHAHFRSSDVPQQLHIEKQITTDAGELEESPAITATLEKITTLTRKRRRQSDTNATPPGRGE